MSQLKNVRDPRSQLTDEETDAEESSCIELAWWLWHVVLHCSRYKCEQETHLLVLFINNPTYYKPKFFLFPKDYKT